MTQTSTRRTATAADFTEGTLVFKGNGKVAHRVVRAETPEGYGLIVWISKVGNKATTAPHWEYAEKLTVEA